MCVGYSTVPSWELQAAALESQRAQINQHRPLIEYKDSFTIDGRDINVRLQKDKIRIGCTEITPEAASLIVAMWKAKFEP